METELKLPISYNKNGFTYNFVEESEKVAIYRQAGTNIFEVFKKKATKRGDAKIGGVMVHFEPKYQIPSNESFGSWAWSVVGMDEAQKVKGWIEQDYIPYKNAPKLIPDVTVKENS